MRPYFAVHLIGVTSVVLAGRAGAQTRDFVDYVGTYEYHGKTTIELVAAPAATGARLVAVLDEAKYPLRFLGDDLFLNGVGDTIPFERDTEGWVLAFRERGVRFSRLEDTVTRVTAASVIPRPRGRDGRVAPYVYRPPADLNDGIAVGDIGQAGLPRALAETLVARVLDGTYPDIDAVLLYRRGRLVLEEYFYGHDQSRPHQVRSATKSVLSAAIGIAVDQGKLVGERERVLPRLPYGPLTSYENPDSRKASMTLGDLLTMRSGLACDDWDPTSPGNENGMQARVDWVKAVLDLPMVAAPGTVARYCSGGVFVAGRMLERAVGETLPAFAQRHLFAPLGIRATDVRWPFVLDSSNAGTYAAMRMRPRDMLKFGVLFHDGGRWKGKQILARAWVARSTAATTRMGSRGYGYFWWRQPFDVATPTGTRRIDALNASGNGGQKIYVLPELDAVIVFTGSAYNNEHTPPNTIMQEILLPALVTDRRP
jgi:CubicO group peptidase (beta-lactamase class C family)